MIEQNASVAEAAERELVITRVFDAPREMVFRAWTEPEHMARWWGPKGFGIHVGGMDLRPGGRFHYSMQSPEGERMWGIFIYREITPPERLVFTNSFSDEDGNIVRAPFSATWPLEVMNTLTLVEHEGKTTLTLRGGPVDATDEERRTFQEGFASMEQGFGGTMDQLTEYLAEVNA